MCVIHNVCVCLLKIGKIENEKNKSKKGEGKEKRKPKGKNDRKMLHTHKSMCVLEGEWSGGESERRIENFSMKYASSTHMPCG